MFIQRNIGYQVAAGYGARCATAGKGFLNGLCGAYYLMRLKELYGQEWDVFKGFYIVPVAT